MNSFGPITPFEQRLAADARWALTQGSIYFEQQGLVHETVRRIAKHLGNLGIDYAVAGGLALFFHGYRRFTQDVDLVVNRAALGRIHREKESLGYFCLFPNSKHVYDAASGVRIKFLIAGDVVGNSGSPFTIPEPALVAEELEGLHCLSLPALLNLKIASGMSSPLRARDLADAQELIRILKLDEDFASHLHPYVQSKYAVIWAATQPVGRRFVLRWNWNVVGSSPTFDALISHASPSDAALLTSMKAEGIAIEETNHGYVRLVTTNGRTADRFEMPDETDYMDEP